MSTENTTRFPSTFPSLEELRSRSPHPMIELVQLILEANRLETQAGRWTLRQVLEAAGWTARELAYRMACDEFPAPVGYAPAFHWDAAAVKRWLGKFSDELLTAHIREF